MQTEELQKLVVAALEDMKAEDIRTLDVRGMTALTDCMVIASGTSDRHVKSLARAVQDRARAAGVRPLGVEGENAAEWILIDLCDVVVHVMRPQTRDFYNLEKLWSVSADASAVEDLSAAQTAARRRH
ncbi:MAG: ribosome silencing factor [Gammaproteobacteria bacterium]